MQAIGRPGTTIGRLGRRTSVLLAIVGLVAACSSQGGGGQPTGPATTQAPPSAAAQSMSATPPAPADVTLAVATDPELGDYVTGADGRVLYVFLPDVGKDTSQCTGDCAGNWPPLTGAVAAEAGVTGELGVVTRDDGSLQATLGGAPLYYYVADQKAGDTKGQGLNEVWYLASPAGTAVGVDDAPPAEPTPCGARYCY